MKILKKMGVLKIELEKFFDSELQEFYTKGIHDLPSSRAKVIISLGDYIFDKWYFVLTRESFYALGLRVITRNFGCNAKYRASTRYGILKA